ncbi:MAG: hypothetical protein RL885_00595 [Planctomycetota bacterium]
MNRRRLSRKKSCTNCGEIIPAKALACPECGSDAETGWSDETYLDGIDLGDDYDEEAYLDTVGQLMGVESPRSETRRWRRVAWIVILALLLPLIVGLYFLLQR